MCIRDSLWDKQITAKTKTKIFKTIVRSIMIYGSEVWTTNKHTRTKLMTAEMDFWIRSARVSRRCLLYTSTDIQSNASAGLDLWSVAD